MSIAKLIKESDSYFVSYAITNFLQTEIEYDDDMSIYVDKLVRKYNYIEKFNLKILKKKYKLELERLKEKALFLINKLVKYLKLVQVYPTCTAIENNIMNGNISFSLAYGIDNDNNKLLKGSQLISYFFYRNMKRRIESSKMILLKKFNWTNIISSVEYYIDTHNKKTLDKSNNIFINNNIIGINHEPKHMKFNIPDLFSLDFNKLNKNGWKYVIDCFKHFHSPDAKLLLDTCVDGNFT